MADFHDSITLPETRAALEELIEAALTRLDQLDDDPDLEPTLGAPSPKATPCVDLGGWMSTHLGRLAGVSARGELCRDFGLSQEHWAEGDALDETEEVSEDEQAQDDREPEEEDWNPDSEDHGPAISVAMSLMRANCGRHDWKAEQAAQEVTTSACQAIVDDLRTVQRRLGRKPVDRLRALGRAIVR